MPTEPLGETALTPLIEDRGQQASRRLLDLAREIPDECFDWRPVAGVRSCAEVLRHVAFWNQYVAGTLRGRSVDDSTNEIPAVEYRAKAYVCEALERSSNTGVSITANSLWTRPPSASSHQRLVANLSGFNDGFDL